MRANFIEVNAGKQPTPLLFGEPYSLLSGLWPAEKIFLQPFVPEAKPGLIPVEGFDLVPGTVAEDEQRVIEGRMSTLLFNNQRQSIDALAKIHMSGIEVDGGCINKHFHGAISRMSVASQRGETPDSICKVQWGSLRIIRWEVRPSQGVRAADAGIGGASVADEVVTAGGTAGINAVKFWSVG